MVSYYIIELLRKRLALLVHVMQLYWLERTANLCCGSWRLCCSLPADPSSCLTDPPSDWLPSSATWICDANSCRSICVDPSADLYGSLTVNCNAGM
jgi:hypothetical protein